MEEFSYALIWLGFFACIFLGWYFYLQARNKERMALIEKNADVSEIFKTRKIRFPWLKLGMTILGVGFGFCLALFLSLDPATPYLQGEVREMMLVGSMLVFGGLGLVIAYFIEKPKVL